MQRTACVCLVLAVCLFGPAAAVQKPAEYTDFISALSQPRFSRIVQTLTTLGLDKTFSNKDLKLTVFAPTDEAFSAAQARSPVSGNSLLGNRSIMQQLIYYHIAKEVVAAPLPQGKELPTMTSGRSLTGDGMTVKAIGSTAKIVEANIKAGAGLLQVIDNMLIPINMRSLGVVSFLG